MADKNEFCICQCFFTNNYFLKAYNVHVQFIDRQQLTSTYKCLLESKGCDNEDAWEAVFQELEKEYRRRRDLFQNSKKRKEVIAKKYVPLHPEVYTLQERFLKPEFLQLVEKCKQKPRTKPDLLNEICRNTQLYKIPVFTEEFCKLFMEEIVNFEQSPFPKGRPNTMNNYGILLNELLNMDDMISSLREDYLNPICKVLYPEWTGLSGLDSHRAFTVKYKLGEDEDLNYHYDNAEITLNCCLGKDFTGGELYFGDMYMLSMPIDMTHCNRIPNEPQFGILHRGRHRHGAFQITSGERYNLIIWMRSSSVRHFQCPMCKCKPILIPAEGFADGFKITTEFVCSVN